MRISCLLFFYKAYFHLRIVRITLDVGLFSYAIVFNLFNIIMSLEAKFRFEIKHFYAKRGNEKEKKSGLLRCNIKCKKILFEKFQ